MDGKQNERKRQVESSSCRLTACLQIEPARGSLSHTIDSIVGIVCAWQYNMRSRHGCGKAEGELARIVPPSLPFPSLASVFLPGLSTWYCRQIHYFLLTNCMQEEKSFLDPALPAEDPERERLEKEIELQARATCLYPSTLVMRDC